MKKIYSLLLLIFLFQIDLLSELKIKKIEFNSKKQREIVGIWNMMRIPNEYTSIENRTIPWGRLVITSKKYFLPKTYKIGENELVESFFGSKESKEKTKEYLLRNLFVLDIKGVSDSGKSAIDQMKKEGGELLAYSIMATTFDDNKISDCFVWLVKQKIHSFSFNVDYYETSIYVYPIIELKKNFFKFVRSKDLGEYFYERFQ